MWPLYERYLDFLAAREEEDGNRYARKADELRNLINSKYYDVERTLYANGLQTAQREVN